MPRTNHTDTLPAPAHTAGQAAPWMANGAPGPVLLIEPDPSQAIDLVRALALLARVRLTSALADGLASAVANWPELVLVSDALPEASLQAWRDTMQRDPLLADVPMAALLSRESPLTEMRALDACAIACLARDAGTLLTQCRVRAVLAMARAAAFWRQHAQSDPLTGLASRGQLDAVLLRAWRNAQRASQPLALLMVDLDHFKAYNDCQGHLGGDACLHHGGTGAGSWVSASIGVSHGEPGEGDPGLAALLASGDAAPYDAKRRGRNTVAWRPLDASPAVAPVLRRGLARSSHAAHTAQGHRLRH